MHNETPGRERSRAGRLKRLLAEFTIEEGARTAHLGFGFKILSDAGNAVAGAYGLIFTLPAEVRRVFRKLGISLPQSNGDDTWSLPLSATYVMDKAGVIRVMHLHHDFTKDSSINKCVKLACSFGVWLRYFSVTDRGGYASSSRLASRQNSCAILPPLFIDGS